LKILASTRLAVGLLATIAVAAAAGTFLPSLDVYRSAWFAALPVLLALNLAACTVRRSPSLRKGFRSPASSAGKEPISRPGVYFIHSGVIVMIIGALIGAVFGFSGEMRIAEKEDADTIYLAPGAARELGFSVRLDRFYVEYYSEGAPKTYRSDITFLRRGTVLGRGSLFVNHPVTFQGLRLSQADYGREAVAVELAARNGRSGIVRRLGPGEECDLPDGATVRVLRIEEDMMRMGPAVKLQAGSGGSRIQFWVFQRFADIEGQYPGLSAMYPQFNPGLFPPWNFSVKEVEGRYYSGIRVTRDPGAPWVAAGAVLMLAGLILSFSRVLLEKKDRS